MNANEAMVKANMWKSLAYIGGCAAIGVAVKVTRSATPLWALLLLSAPSFVTEIVDNVDVSIKEKDDESES